MKKKIEIILPLIIIFFFCISIVNIFSASSILPEYYSNLYLKQIIWYALGFLIFIIILIVGNDRIYRYAFGFYVVSILLLILVLILGNEINNTKGWISIGNLNFQPSEFAKLGITLYLSKILNNYHFKDKKNIKTEFILILKVIVITLIPCILAFIEPDTGSVLSYLFIAFIMIFVSGIKGRWFLLIFILIAIIISLFVVIYINYPNLFINMFGNSFYYRIFRLTDWQTSSGMQLENSLTVIGSSGLTGHGINNIPLYFPEPYTDFIFTVHTSNYGIIGSIALIIIICIFDIRIIRIATKSSKTIDKYLISGIIASLIYPQIQNIAMTLGLLPITGIPLPFVSYGGSSLIVSFIMIALVINVYKRINFT